MNADGTETKPEREAESAQGREQRALTGRMTDAASGNFLCACWHIYLGLKVLLQWQGHAALGIVILCVAGLQIAAGIAMLMFPTAALFLADVGLYVFCAFMNITAATIGGVKWLQYLGMLQLLLAFHAFQRFRRFRGAGASDEAEPVVIGAYEQDAAAESPALPLLTGSGDRTVAGSGHGDSMALTEEQLHEVIASPDSFENVVSGQEAAVGGIPTTWHLVFGKGTAILVDDKAERVWRLGADDVDIGREVIARPKEGKRVTFNPKADGLCPVWAWKCSSQEEFETGRGWSVWDLLCWSLTYDREPETWLRWQPSYGTRDEGLDVLCSSSDLLEKQMKKWGAGKAAKWLRVADANQAAMLQPKIADIASAMARKARDGAVVLGAVGVLLALIAVVVAKALNTSVGYSTIAMIFLMFGIAVLIGAAVYFGVSV